MKFMRLSLLAVVVLTIASVAAKAQSADEIMDKHIAAIGGADKWNNLKTLKMVGSMSPQPGVEITMTSTVDMEKKGVRVDMSAMGMTGWIIITPQGGWMYMPMMGSTKIDTMKPEMLAMYQKQMDVKGKQQLDYKTNGSKLEYTGKDTINNAACYKVKITDKDGNETTSYFDCNTYYILRSEVKAKINDEETEIATVYDNYKTLDGGIVMPMSVTAQGQEITYKSIEVNKPLDANLFVPSMDAAAH